MNAFVRFVSNLIAKGCFMSENRVNKQRFVRVGSHIIWQLLKKRPVSIGRKKYSKKYDCGASKHVYDIVACDESWIYAYESKNKQQSAVWEMSQIQQKLLAHEALRKKLLGKMVEMLIQSLHFQCNSELCDS